MTIGPDTDRLLKETSVLLVDDEELLRVQAQGMLAGELKALHLAASGQEGLFTYALHRPDLLVLDVRMPGMDGLELARAVRGMNPEVPVVLLTALDDAEVFRQAMALGISGYLAKPLDREQLLETIGRSAAALHLKRELSRQLKLNELMLDAAPSPSILADLASGRIVSGNQLAAALGYTVGAPCEGPLIPKDLLAGLTGGGQGLMQTASSSEVSAHGRHWVLHWAPVGAGSVLLTAVDISQRVKFEHFRDDVERMARHDLKSPLSAFTSVPELLLEDDNLTEQQREFIGLIRDAGTRMLAMINLSLDLFKMETGTYQGLSSCFNFAGTVREAARAAENLGRSLGVGIRLEAPAGEIPVRGDEQHCRSMLDNLIKNALEASPRGAEVVLVLSGGGAAQARIENQGEVPLDIRERFFEKYVTSGKRMGTGLGTYSARMVARALGGDTVLDASIPGRTAITVLLPVARA